MPGSKVIRVVVVGTGVGGNVGSRVVGADVVGNGDGKEVAAVVSGCVGARIPVMTGELVESEASGPTIYCCTMCGLSCISCSEQQQPIVSVPFASVAV